MVQVISQILGVVALLASLRLPYEFYLIIRVIMCFGSIFCLIKNFNEPNGRVFRAGLFAIVIIYNPLLPLGLPKIAWIFVNIATGIFLLAGRIKN